MLPKFLLFTTLIALSSSAAFADSIVVYGDSLSDNGNFYAATGQPPFPYYQGRASNGPVAVELLANQLGATLIDDAWLGATTGIGNSLTIGTVTSLGGGLPGMTTSFNNTRASLGPYLNGWFVVWGGPDDFSAPDPSDAFPAGVIARGVGNLVSIIGGLESLGAQRILVPGIPDLGLTPRYQSQGPVAAAAATGISNAFNTLLQSELLQFPGGVVYFDTGLLLRNIVSNPSAYGFANVTAPCFNGLTVCSDPNAYLFWDDLHPTEAGHEILADDFAAAVPEPSAASLVCITLVLAAVARIAMRRA